MKLTGFGVVVVMVLSLAARSGAQTATQASSAAVVVTELTVLTAEERRAPTSRDLAILRSGARSRDPQTARMAVRALGRLERPEVIADIIPSLRDSLPEIRAEAAIAIGQAAHGWVIQRTGKPPARTGFELAFAALIARSNLETEADVRAAISETLGRLPYTAADQVERAELAILDLMSRGQSAADRLGVAQGLEVLVRLHRSLRSPSADALATLRALTSSTAPAPENNTTAGRAATQSVGTSSDPAREARIRRLAFSALISARATDEELIRRTATDPDAQVRRLAMLALADSQVGATDAAGDVLRAGLLDSSPMVRVEAVKAAANRLSCAFVMASTRDPEIHVALTALDLLAKCPSSDEAVAVLGQLVDDIAEPSTSRGRQWHRSAHALVALASTAPSRAAAVLPRFLESGPGLFRVYVAQAATILADRAALEKLARDSDDNVCEAAIQGLAKIAGHDADGLYVAALGRPGYQVLRAAAYALAGTQDPEAAPALKVALGRLVGEARENSLDARTAITDTLRGLDVTAASAVAARAETETAGLTVSALRRLAAARARVTIRGLGRFDLALIAGEAPLSTLRFVRLATSGYYNGLTFHRVVPNFFIQGGSPGANEYVGDAAFMRDELGRWPHVRGAVGISTRGRDTGDAQFFIDLVDNPRLDHEYTVFAHVLNGMDVVDAILEGDVIEGIEIIE